MLGLGLSLWQQRASALLTDFAWTGLWQGSFAASPWAGTTSGGTSGGRNLTEATNPPGVSAPQGGFTAADFDGTNDQLGTGRPWSDFITTTSLFFDLVVNADAVPAAGNLDEQTFVGDDAAFAGLTFNADGLSIALAAGGLKSRTIAAATGSYHHFQARLLSNVLSARLNGSAWSNVAAATPIGNLDGMVSVGKNYNGTVRFNGKVLHLGVSDVGFSDAQADTIRALVVARYEL
jgi:hypothetical protein